MGIAEYGTTGFYVLPRLTFRCKRDKWIFQEIMSEANFKDNEKCKRGQVVFIMKDYAKETNWSEDQIKYSLKQLKTMGLIQWQLYRGNTKNGLLITVNHYDEFQNLGSYSRQKGSNFPEENPEEFPPEFPKREDAENPNVSRDEGASDGQDSRRASEDNPEEIPEVYKNSIKEQHVKHKKILVPNARSAFMTNLRMPIFWRSTYEAVFFAGNRMRMSRRRSRMLLRHGLMICGR